MKLKSLALVVAVLAVLSAIVFFAQRPAAPVGIDPRVGKPLVDVDVVKHTVKVHMSDQGKSILLVKDSEAVWRVPGYYNLPADFTKLSRLVGDFTEAKVDRLVTSSPEKMARLEFKDAKIAFLDADDKELWSVTLGKFSDTGARFLRFGSEQKAYLSEIAGMIETEPKTWANSELLALKPDEIAKVEISFADEAGLVVTATRAKKEDPFAAVNAPMGMRLKSDAISTILGATTSLNFIETFDPADPAVAAAKQHTRSLKLTTFAGVTTTIAMGRKPEEKVVKAPGATPGGAAKAGPSALLDMAQAATADKPDAPKPGEAPDGPGKALEAMIDTVPAGPVIANITSSDAKAPVNSMMQKRAFQITDFAYTSLPQKSEDLFEPAAKPGGADAPAGR